MPDSQTRQPPYFHLLQDVVTGLGLALSPGQMEQLAVHFALLVQWNRKVNLTSVRRPEEIVTRHFEESLFPAKILPAETGLLVDVGSGAGFPGLPLKVVWPEAASLLLEPNKKKASFLKEVIRQSGLRTVAVRTERLSEALSSTQEASECLAGRATLATMRAVGVTGPMLDGLARLVAPRGRVALFLGEEDAQGVSGSPAFAWENPVAIPHSERRVLLIGHAGATGTPLP